MKKHSLMILALALLAVSCGDKKSSTGNPFFDEWNTPYGVPPFDQIKTEHFLPAYEQAFIEQDKEIADIIANKEEPTFENTIAAFDRSGQLLSKVGATFGALSRTVSNDSLQGIEKQITPMATTHSDNIRMNADLFAKVKSVYDRREAMGLTPEQLRLTEEMYKDFVRGGINLSPDDQKTLRELNEQIGKLQLQFGQNLLAETKAYKLVIDKKEDLAGLPDGAIAAAAEMAKKDSLEGKWVFTLDNPSVMPFLQYADSRELRKQLFNAYINRGNNNNANDNKKLIAELVTLRARKAQLMGYANFAEFVLEERMAKNSANVYALLDQVWNPALAVAKQELTDMQAEMKKDGGQGELEGWDWRYYSEKVLKAKYDLNDEMLRPYFQVSSVRDGIFYTANKLYGITFNEVKDIPKYHPDVEFFEVKDVDGSLLAVIYFDYYARAGQKNSGAWCGRLRSQGYGVDGKRIIPIVAIVCNFPSPTANKPSLLSPDETETLFHEFGHALHGFFANVHYYGVASVPRDFVELPSQIMEHWAFQPQVLAQYAKHYQTGEVIPQELVDKMDKAGKFGQGFKTVEYTAAALLDMDYHVLTNVTSDMDVLKFEADAMNKVGLLKQIPPRYRSTYFQHTMTGGYTAGYYSYLWSEVLDADGFQAFVEKGDIFDQETASKFRKQVLERGNSEDPMLMYVRFRRAEPNIDALLKNRGLK